MTTTETPGTPFPERMRKRAVETHARRAKAALKMMAEKMAEIERRLDAGVVDEYDDARGLGALAAEIHGHVAALGVLCEVREWDEAEQAATKEEQS